jgi:Holliday junction resolvase RusA-like endonuclease
MKFVAVEKPNYDEIRRNILREYNRATGSNLEEDIKSNDDRLINVVGWLNNFLSIGALSYTMVKSILVTAFSPELSDKASAISQFHCPLCIGEGLIVTINIRIPPISLQLSDSQTNEAFKRAIKYRLSRTHNYGNQRLCVHVVFVLRNKRHRMDVDNMAKGFLDSLQGVLYDNDNQIDHLNLHKLMWEGDEEHVSVNIRETHFNRHEDVLYHKFLHSWAGQEELRLEDFMKTEAN